MRLIHLLVLIACLSGCRHRPDWLLTAPRQPTPETAKVTPSTPPVAPRRATEESPLVPPAEPPAPAEDPKPEAASLTERVRIANQSLRDAFFAYDSFVLDANARDALLADASVLRPLLRDFPGVEVVIEGHCDERGSAEYNLGLGDSRAERARAFLVDLGVARGSLRTVSYGREKPQCTDATEECHARNRRAHVFVAPAGLQ